MESHSGLPGNERAGGQLPGGEVVEHRLTRTLRAPSRLGKPSQRQLHGPVSVAAWPSVPRMASGWRQPAPSRVEPQSHRSVRGIVTEPPR